ncbi:MAG: glycine cleavage system protein H [Planctomycetota bacterium]
MQKIPDDRTYTETHEWVKIDAEIVRMGVTAPLLESLGPLVSLELPRPDYEMMVNIAIGTVESDEAVHDIMPPADAGVLEVNTDLEWNLDTLADDPYGAGWLMKIKVHDPDQLRDLLTPQAYCNHCEEVWSDQKVKIEEVAHEQ